MAALLLLWTFLRRRYPATTTQEKKRTPDSWPQGRDKARLAAVSVKEAEHLASLESAQPPDPVVHLQQAVRIKPTTHRESAHQICENYRSGHVVIVDLASTDEVTAARLGDFCSGMITASRDRGSRCPAPSAC
ncbi:cell division protein SepF [Kibdelosporangium phytohabitans]|uniref:cell division protein SepF n=1 Tax=Kibdelosporangium phytohabitans TaxID=860235 RepID=UPI003AAAA271